MLISLLVLPDYLLIISQSEEEVSCPVSIPLTPQCATMVPLSQQQLSAQLCCSCRISQLWEQSPTCGREGGNCCFAFAPFAKFNIPGLILIKPDPMACLGFFLKSKASQSSLGTKALSESECHHRGILWVLPGPFWNLFLLLLKAPRPLSYR